MSSKRIDGTEMHKLRCLTDTLWRGATYDQLNLGSIACFEAVTRKIQAIVEAYTLGQSVPLVSGARGGDVRKSSFTTLKSGKPSWSADWHSWLIILMAQGLKEASN